MRHQSNYPSLPDKEATKRNKSPVRIYETPEELYAGGYKAGMLAARKIVESKVKVRNVTWNDALVEAASAIRAAMEGKP